LIYNQECSIIITKEQGVPAENRKWGDPTERNVMSFEDFKKRSMSGSNVQDLSKKLEKMNEKNSYKDERFWRPELDKSSNGYAVIRFLDCVQGEDVPFAKYFSHGFQGPGGWYIENSRTTLGEKDPVSEMNTKLWNSGVESDKDIARTRKRKTNYVSNIYIVSDPANPQNEGKVFLFRYGTKIFNKIQESMQPEFEDEKPVNVFNLWSGADFKLKIRRVSGFLNYDKSEFASPSPLLEGDDSVLKDIWDKQYPLSEFTDPENFKSYDELKKRLHEVIGDNVRSMISDSPKSSAENIAEESSATEDSTSTVTEESDALSYFEKLASED